MFLLIHWQLHQDDNRFPWHKSFPLDNAHFRAAIISDRSRQRSVTLQRKWRVDQVLGLSRHARETSQPRPISEKVIQWAYFSWALLALATAVVVVIIIEGMGAGWVLEGLGWGVGRGGGAGAVYRQNVIMCTRKTKRGKYKRWNSSSGLAWASRLLSIALIIAL